ncbi:MAG: alginate export family protein [Opitutae bacterium]|nr:alginate export family protein [Opitutae bacterium]
MQIRHLLPVLLGLGSAGALVATEPASLNEALAQGQVSLNARLRHESVAQTGLRDAAALTLRTRLGYTTASFHGWKVMLEAENITAADGDSYSQAGLNPGGAGKAVIADPETTELNQAWLACTVDKSMLAVGRQRLVFDTARFIGDVGWRQNMQTFDAVMVQDKSLDQTVLTYAYVDQVNRVFGHEHAQGKWESDSHLFNAVYTGYAAGTLTGYAYLLDFANSAANSCATYGVSFAGKRPVGETLKFAYRVEYARQSDHAPSALNYSADYYVLEAGLNAKTSGLTLGYEVLGSGRNVGFKTPLATLHAFNGWADLFLATPAAGLRDIYMKASATLPGEVSLLAFYHQFAAARGGAGFGEEFDVQLARKFAQRFTATAKYADFRRDSPAFPNVRKLWLQLDFAH